ncbi:MAG: hypothetical protein ACFB10_14930 [Salibacteraceae bacterium]
MKNKEKKTIEALAEKAKSIATTKEMVALVGGRGITVTLEDLA